MSVTNVDLFTECLRWFVWTIMLLAFMLVLGWGCGKWAHSRLRKWTELYPDLTPYDQDAVLDAHDMYPRSAVSIPDRIPEGWMNEWQ